MANNRKQFRHLETIWFPPTTHSQERPNALLTMLLIVVPREAVDHDRQSGPHIDRQPGCSIRQANRADLKVSQTQEQMFTGIGRNQN